MFGIIATPGFCAWLGKHIMVAVAPQSTSSGAVEGAQLCVHTKSGDGHSRQRGGPLPLGVTTFGVPRRAGPSWYTAAFSGPGLANNSFWLWCHPYYSFWICCALHSCPSPILSQFIFLFRFLKVFPPDPGTHVCNKKYFSNNFFSWCGAELRTPTRCTGCLLTLSGFGCCTRPTPARGSRCAVRGLRLPLPAVQRRQQQPWGHKQAWPAGVWSHQEGPPTPCGFPGWVFGCQTSPHNIGGLVTGLICLHAAVASLRMEVCLY